MFSGLVDYDLGLFGPLQVSFGCWRNVVWATWVWDCVVWVLSGVGLRVGYGVS